MIKTVMAGFIGACAALATVSVSAAVIHTSDFIDDSSRANFAGFESLAGEPFYASTSYTEDGLTINQIHSEGLIKTDCYACFGGSMDGDASWYPNGGDYGYTKITLATSADFTDIGFLAGSGRRTDGLPLFLMYELWNNGLPVQQGSVHIIERATNYIGFSGGGFDEIRVRDTTATAGSFYDGTINGLAIDSIETAVGGSTDVPEPGSLALVGLALGALALRRKQA